MQGFKHQMPSKTTPNKIPRSLEVIARTFLKGAYLGFSLSAACHATAASFDCKKASSDVEKQICSSSTLSQLDDELSRSYKAALEHTKDADYLKKEQIEWLLSSRNKCKDSECLEEKYKQRIQLVKSNQTICSLRKFINLVLTQNDYSAAKKMVADDDCNWLYLPFVISSNNSEFALSLLELIKAPPDGDMIGRAAGANPEILRAVVKKGGNVNYIEPQYGYYPLHEAITSIHISEEKILANVKYILELGANVNHIDKFHDSALRHAVEHNYVIVTKYLLDKGADPIQYDRGGEQSGFTIIMEAITHYQSHKDPRIIKELLARGANPNDRDTGNYDYACDMEYAGKCTWNGYSLLTYAIRHNLPDLVQILVKAGADINLPRSDGLTPRRLAVQLERYDMLKTLNDSEANK